ncbi:DUF3135 domain-containing protein [Thermodesulfobacteriota bacterium B35]
MKPWKTREQGEEEHRRLKTLFKEDRLAFERERRRLISETIASYDDPRIRESLQRQQQQLDRVLRHAGSAENRFSLIRAMFWDQIVNRFIPATRGAGDNLRPDREKKENVPPGPHLTLVRRNESDR